MLLEGEVNIKASRETVYKYLTDAELVSRCMPGVKSMEVLAPNKKFRAVGAVGLGSVKMNVTNDVEWTELDPPNGAKMKIHGTTSGSSMDTTSEMALSDGADGSTDMKWSADVNVVGTIASLAMRLMKPVTKKLTSQFFDCVKKQIEK